MADKCFACDRTLGRSYALVDTRDDQLVYVGSECFKLVVASGDRGYQPPKGGPRLYAVTACDCENPEPKSGVALISNTCIQHN
jgi:hypothetical protein